MPHEHGTGRYKVTSWIDREDCEECTRADARLARLKEVIKSKYATYTDGEKVEVDADGIIVDAPEAVTLSTLWVRDHYEACVEAEVDGEGYRRGFGKTPEDAIAEFHAIHNTVDAPYMVRTFPPVEETIKDAAAGLLFIVGAVLVGLLYG
jgi:hypothetical protein